jgi:hypothetical protein
MPRGHLKGAEGVSRKKIGGGHTRDSRRHKRYHPPPISAAKTDAPPEDFVLCGGGRATPPPRTFAGYCAACLDHNTAVLALGKCGHTACVPCLTRYYSLLDLAHYPLHCAMCPAPVTLAAIQRDGLLDERQAAISRQLSRAVRQRERPLCYKTVFCERCTQANIMPRARSRATCQVCRFAMECATTRFPAIVMLAFAGQNAELGLCPKCGAMLEKVDGCSAVTCFCGADFLFKPILQDACPTESVEETGLRLRHSQRWTSPSLAH